MIKVKNLVKKYGDFAALDGISFKISQKGVIGLLGPNGAGKTTTMKILTCYIPATSGEVLIFGLDVNKDQLKIKRKIGYLPENNPLYGEMSVKEYLEYCASLKGVDKKGLPKQVEYAVLKCGLKEKLNQDIGKLSKGYRQRVGVAQSLLGSPEILILDEPTVGLDPNQILEIRELIKSIGKEKIVILSSHIMAEVEATCDKILIINKGKIVAEGSPEQLKAGFIGHTVITIKLAMKEGLNNLLKLIKGMDGVISVEQVSSDEENTVAYEIKTSEGRDIRSNIVKDATANGFELLDITKKVVKLEDVFAQLTK